MDLEQQHARGVRPVGEPRLDEGVPQLLGLLAVTHDLGAARRRTPRTPLELKETLTSGMAVRSPTRSECSSAKNHRSPSNSTSCSPMGRLTRCPLSSIVVSMAIRASLTSSGDLLPALVLLGWRPPCVPAPCGWLCVTHGCPPRFGAAAPGSHLHGTTRMRGRASGGRGDGATGDLASRHATPETAAPRPTGVRRARRGPGGRGGRRPPARVPAGLLELEPGRAAAARRGAAHARAGPAGLLPRRPATGAGGLPARAGWSPTRWRCSTPPGSAGRTWSATTGAPAVAWAAAASHPDRVASLTVLSTPHPPGLRLVAAPLGAGAALLVHGLLPAARPAGGAPRARGWRPLLRRRRAARGGRRPVRRGGCASRAP